jgi:hypothetical protein
MEHGGIAQMKITNIAALWRFSLIIVIISLLLPSSLSSSALLGSWGKLSTPRSAIAATSIPKKYAMFGGGSGSNRVDIYHIKSRTWSQSTLSSPRDGAVAASVEKFALFAGGNVNSATESESIDIWNSDTSEWSTINLSQPVSHMAVASVQDRYAVFAGGSPASELVYIFDATTGQISTSEPLSTKGMFLNRFQYSIV